MLFSLPSALVVLCAVCCSGAALPSESLEPEKADNSDFSSLRGLSKNHKDMSGRAGDPKSKYFHESIFHPHYDGRFAMKTLPEEYQHGNLSTMMQSYLATMSAIGAETWIMHGSLLGWWWNRKIMPWDSDVDVQVSERSIKLLANYYNMTVHKYKGEDWPRAKKYLMEVNEHYSNGSTLDRMNAIDARWIDTETGLFIDITTLRRDRDAEKKGETGKLYSKDRQRFDADDIYPLRQSEFEGKPVKIPYAYTRLLEQEYSPKALTKLSHSKHDFDRKTYEWVKQTQKP
ncbi:hypothetical protein EJ05DRAFT_121266 [Pseudovirgaria hyperparasitica]|uniref:LicD/FKTN/FKRP nucleotidyltransferase domain-containing protein n=1 Tax=Pseudovirgaria hyperparasitica TaxID=470096 RepID=A0A6A6VZ96_9PEZI|nr:uncharacterized protein EJ05DRAFT_121266 [Pseudovirgaria hyperparasitica]KAF2755074.1 hypothetical protein EJ05DRAFT_121266 [Pseudovirgaria hyperparasitica]